MKRIIVTVGVLILLSGVICTVYRPWRILPYPVGTGGAAIGFPANFTMAIFRWTKSPGIAQLDSAAQA